MSTAGALSSSGGTTIGNVLPIAKMGWFILNVSMHEIQSKTLYLPQTKVSPK